jgi:nicotinate-nucleotide pyrophosphorylase (carboxylating)
MTRGHTKLEVSGGISLRNVRAVAKTGVNYISVGALTHSAAAVDVSLDLERPARTFVTLPSTFSLPTRR